MKTNKTTRVTFSAESNAINVTLPKSWTELSQRELRTVYRCQTLCEPEDVIITLFRALSGMDQVSHFEDGSFKARFESDLGPKYVRIWPEALAEFTECLEFINDPGDDPVRFDAIDGHEAVDARLHGVTFHDYLQIETLIQGYLMNQNPKAVKRLAVYLYPGYEGARPLGEAESLNIVTWVVQIKRHFARQFRHFFRPAGEEVEDSTLLERINAQIRALTGGDITKESEVYDTDCWRALTELDAKAKEAEDFRREQSKKP